MFKLNKRHLRYEKYIPTNIDWIGSIPDGWEIWKLKRLGIIETGNTPPKADDNNYSENGIPWIKPDNLNDFIPLNNSKERLSNLGLSQARLVKKGSVLVCGIGTIGKIGVAGCDLTTNQQINSITFNEKVDELFGQYLIFASQKEMERNSNKVVVSILNKSQQSNIFYPVSPIQEQQKIANYLDEKTLLIDEIIEKRKNQINLLSEHRTALINNAITKGLDINTEMKESGIEWIGKIPKGWKIEKLKFMLNDIQIGPFGSMIKSEFIKDTGYKIYGQENLINTDFSLGGRFVDEEKYQELIKYKTIPGEILVSMMGTIGKCEIVPENIQVGIIDSHLMKFSLNQKKVLNNYFQKAYSTKSYIWQQLVLANKGSIMMGLNSTIIKNLFVVLPPIEEQQKIVDYLNKETEYVGDMLEKIEQSIELLQEYKASLISHAVSGKIKIG